MHSSLNSKFREPSIESSKHKETNLFRKVHLLAKVNSLFNGVHGSNWMVPNNDISKSSSLRDNIVRHRRLKIFLISTQELNSESFFSNNKYFNEKDTL